MIFRQPFVGDYPITQKYGELIKGVTFDNRPHTGIDYGCPQGTPILASADGTVMAAGWDLTGYGFRVIIKHTEDKSTLYAHLDDITVSKGQKVKQGENIGHSGCTGSVIPKGPGGAHLHFEARRYWTDYKSTFDPMALPLTSMDDTITAEPDTQVKPSHLLEPDELGQRVVVVAPKGAKVFNPDWSMRYYGFQPGTELYFTGKTVKRPGFPQFTYCEVYEEPRKFYVAVHDGDCQILANE